jgi:16S rRNA (cytosine1402-N4)-methyltransferase
LVDIIIGVLGYHRGMKVHPATRTFQALRIHVNREMDELDQGLRAAEKLLAPGGRIAAVSFHSLEDRRVKRFLLDRSGSNPRGSRHRPPEQAVGPAPTFELLRRGTIKPSNEETRKNPRARSARLRVAIRTNAPAWSEQEAA